MSTSWLEIAVATATSYVDELAGLIASAVSQASAGLEVREREVAFWVAEGDERAALVEVRSLLATLAAAGAPVAVDDVEVRATPPEKEWREAYKRYFRVARLSRQIVVVPSWETFEPGPDDRVLHLDPGQAFGTGSHETTTLVLRELQRLADGGHVSRRALDVGTGSGILTLAVSRLGLASELVAFDCDPLAVSAAAENCERNDVPATIERAEAPASRHGVFELIVANIQRHVLLELREAITAAAAPSATLVLSGLLLHQLDELSSAYRERGWLETQRETETEWGVLVLERHTDASSPA